MPSANGVQCRRTSALMRVASGKRGAYMTAPPNIPEATEPQVWLDPEDYPNVDHLITEDDTPLDNLFVAKQQRLLVIAPKEPSEADLAHILNASTRNW